MDYFSMSADEVLKALKTNKEKGLSTQLANKRLNENGKNEVTKKRKFKFLRSFFIQFTDFMMIILIIASVISFVTAVLSKSGDYADPIIIIAIVIINAFIGTFQESKAEKAIDSIKNLSSPHTTVLRDGKQTKIDSRDVVVGDIIILSTGDLIPTDARIIESFSLKTEESALTGESLPIEKNAATISAKECSISDMHNMVFASTIVISGHCTAVVTGTGKDTQVGKIADLLQNEESPDTPLKIRLAKIGKLLGIASLIICAVIFVIGIFRKIPILESFLLSVTLAVAAIPEGLPATVTIVLSLGVQRMSKRKSIIRHLPAVETLGSATVICSDKTGTLTQNLMTVTEVRSPLGVESTTSNAYKNILTLGSLCNNSKIIYSAKNQKVVGDPLENAIISALTECGINHSDLLKVNPRIDEIPFSSSRKLMSTIHKIKSGFRIITKGAPDVLVQKCSKMVVGNNTLPIDKQKILSQNDAMTSSALRVIAVAYRDISSSSNVKEEDLIFAGLIGMLDPPRKEAKKAVADCKGAGIIPVMITGDHKNTAAAIARELEILDDEHLCITGDQLNKISDEELINSIENYRVFARVSPEHKVRIIKAFQSKSHVVAMTGDGVNDAPALKVADIGCAMGKSGTDVAKSAADLVLTDDNFATIVSAVSEGRGIYDNIKKAIHFLLSSNIGEILVVFIASIMGIGVPLLPIQLLWINLVTDSLPAMALGMELPDKDIMNRKPILQKENLFSLELWIDILVEGMLIGAISLLAFIIGKNYFDINGQIMNGQTMAFTVLGFSELIHAFNTRSDQSLFKIGFFSNKKLLLSFLICGFLQISVVVFPIISKLFGTATLSPIQFFICFGFSVMPLIIVEISKAVKQKLNI